MVFITPFILIGALTRMQTLLYISLTAGVLLSAWLVRGWFQRRHQRLIIRRRLEI